MWNVIIGGGMFEALSACNEHHSCSLGTCVAADRSLSENNSLWKDTLCFFVTVPVHTYTCTCRPVTPCRDIRLYSCQIQLVSTYKFFMHIMIKGFSFARVRVTRYINWVEPLYMHVYNIRIHYVLHEHIGVHVYNCECSTCTVAKAW